jgi:ribonuclease HI
VYLIISDGGHRSGITYGSFKIFNEDGDVVAHKQMVFGVGTSNLAEYLTLINSLKYAIVQGMNEVVVMVDSALVLHQVAGDWSTNDEHLIFARDKVRDLINNFDYCRIKKVTRNTVKHHLGH